MNLKSDLEDVFMRDKETQRAVNLADCLSPGRLRWILTTAEWHCFLFLLSFSGELHWSWNSCQFHPREQDWARKLHLWQRGLLRLQPGILPVWLIGAHLPARRPLGQASSRMHWYGLVHILMNHHKIIISSAHILSCYFLTAAQPLLFQRPWLFCAEINDQIAINS